MDEKKVLSRSMLRIIMHLQPYNVHIYTKTADNGE